MLRRALSLFSINPRQPHSGDLGLIVLARIWAWLTCSHMPKQTELRGEMCQVPKQQARCESTLKLLKWLIQTCPHMSMSQCGNICIMPPKCVRKERLCGFSNRSSVDAGSHVRETLCVSMRTLEIMVKLRTLLTVCTLFWKLKLAIMERGVTFPTRARGVRPITMHCASWPIKADCACWKEGLCKKHLRAAGLRGTIIMYSIWKIYIFFTLKHVNIFCYTK